MQREHAAEVSRGPRGSREGLRVVQGRMTKMTKMTKTMERVDEAEGAMTKMRMRMTKPTTALAFALAIVSDGPEVLDRAVSYGFRARAEIEARQPTTKVAEGFATTLGQCTVLAWPRGCW